MHQALRASQFVPPEFVVEGIAYEAERRPSLSAIPGRMGSAHSDAPISPCPNGEDV